MNAALATARPRHPAPHPLGAAPLRALDMLEAGLRFEVAGSARDLTLRQTAVLLVLRRVDCATVRGLAAQLNLQKPVITRAMDRLVAAGLAQRDAHRQDRRSVLLRITDAGRMMCADLADAMEAGL